MNKEHQRTLDYVVAIVAQIPSRVEWHVVQRGDYVVLCDDRDEATTMLLEAVASQHGDVIATGNRVHAINEREIVGVLVRPDGDVEATAKAMRAGYAIATIESVSEDDDGPF